MNAIHDRSGNVVIQFNSQAEMLEAPPVFPDGAKMPVPEDCRRKYIPCQLCGEVLPVPLNVVSIICNECAGIVARGEDRG